MEINDYLKTIKSNGKSKYKRVTLSPLRYAGGKSKAIGLILENLPHLNEKKIVSPFFGGGSFEIVLSTQLGYEVIGYDIFSFLTNFWNVLINDKDKLVSELNKLIPDKDNFTRNRHILLNYWNKVKPDDLKYETRNLIELTDKEKCIMDDDKIIQAAYYYYNMQLSYGPMFLGWPSSVYMDNDKYHRILDNIKNIDLGNISINCDTFENVITRHNNDFLFLDPPYYLGKDSKMFKGMYPNCNFAIHHNNFNHELMRDLLKKHKGGFFITYNDCPTIREWYKEFKQVYPKWQYTYGQGEKRIGKNRKNMSNTLNNDNENNTNIKESHEIFIISEPY
jgi:DNA adenine methylase